MLTDTSPGERSAIQRRFCAIVAVGLLVARKPRITDCVSAILLAWVLLGNLSCAQKRLSHEKELSDWIISEPRSLVVSADTTSVEPKLFTEESDMGSSIIGGTALGAGWGLFESLEMAGDCHGDFCGAAIVVFSPVIILTGIVGGGVAGAASAKTTEVPYSLPAFEKLIKNIKTRTYNSKLAAIFSSQIANNKPTNAEKFNVRLDENFLKADPASEMLIRVGIKRLSFLFDDPGDTETWIALDASAEVTFPVVYKGINCFGFVRDTTHYQSQAKAIEDWTENDLAVFRMELDSALDYLATDLAERLFSKSDHNVTLRSESLTEEVPSGFEKCSKTPLETEWSSVARGKSRILTKCSDAKISEKPWVGKWAVRRDNALLIFDIEEGVVRGELKSASKDFYILGKVDDNGAIDASIFGRGSWSRMDVRGIFPNVQLTYPYGTPPAEAAVFKVLNGRTIHLCS